MRSIVFEGARSSEIVVLPLLLDMNQSPLPPAKREMLEAGKSQPIVLWIICWLFRSCPFMPTILTGLIQRPSSTS